MTEFYYLHFLKVEFALYIQPSMQYQVTSVMLWEISLTGPWIH